MPTIDIGGQAIHYLAEGVGEALLLFADDVHAVSAYEGEVARLATRYRVLAFDRPGVGASTRDVRYLDEIEFDPWNYRADLACHLLHGLGLERCVVVGVGGGALAALHFAGRQAQLRRQHGDDWRQVVDADTAFLRRIADRGGYAVADGVLNAIRCPVLVAGNLNDDVTPGIAREFARIAGLVPDCSVFLASASGHRHGEEHPLMWTDPKTFWGVAETFLAR